MIFKVEVRNVAGTLLTLLFDDYSNGYYVKEIEGLDPVDAAIVSSDFAGVDGTQFQTASRGARNIIIKLGFEPDYILTSVSSLRRALYGFFMPKSVVNLKFFDTDGLVIDIQGRVEKAPAPLFTDKPGMNISILCDDPDFVEPDPITTSGATVSTTTESFIHYEGTSDSGFVFTLHLNRSLSDFTIYMTNPDGILRQLDFSASLLNGDILTISTVTGDKFIQLNRGGTISSLVYGMPSTSEWLQLKNGFNNFRVYAVGSPIPFDITYVNRHGGL